MFKLPLSGLMCAGAGLLPDAPVTGASSGGRPDLLFGNRSGIKCRAMRIGDHLISRLPALGKPGWCRAVALMAMA